MTNAPNYHPRRACAKCGRIMRIQAGGMCGRCYRRQYYADHPELYQEQLAYQRAYTRRNREDDKLPSPLERVRLFCRVFSVTADDLYDYIMWLRRVHAPRRREALEADARRKHGHAHSTARRTIRCRAS